MIVVNTSPLINFAMIGQFPLLTQLFGRLTIPQAVAQELERHEHRYPNVSKIVLQSSVLDVLNIAPTPLLDTLRLDLDAGEAEVIALAVEQQASLVILDELAARYVAEAQGLKFTGSIGCLAEAKRTGLVSELGPLLDAMRMEAGFWLRDALRERVLRDAGEWNDQ